MKMKAEYINNLAQNQRIIKLKLILSLTRGQVHRFGHLYNVHVHYASTIPNILIYTNAFLNKIKCAHLHLQTL